ncbi:Meiotically up-regulated gene 190 protein [Psilocybe cubensis]|uniref:Meiotically up-regulated gene 190 protein n=2 Tax=Psilocybe cubensis TaxID=181762 RepID=A0ACB8H1M1_PSICU|nr:Meiotically up-regulated gene 190 protein [Psilocybe cubensis]KAH9481678.1 Meiotically up-regulated gene 190 protein [Psilocybe cubensis]
MSEPNAPTSAKPDGQAPRNNEKEVTDPVTHLPLTIHDADTVELERIPPPPTATEEKRIREERGADSQEETNARHSDMERVVDEVVHQAWWEDPIGDTRRARIQTSAVAAVAASLGAFSMLILWSVFARVLGRKQSGSGLGWMGFFLAPFVCCFLGLGVGAAGLALGIYQKPPDLPVEQQQQRNTDHEQREKTLNKDESSPESAEWLNAFLNSLWPVVNPSLFTALSDMLEDAMQATLPKMVNGVRVADIGQGSEAVRILGVRWLDAGSAAKDVDGMKAEEGDFVNMEVALAYRAKETTAKGIRSRSANAHLLMEFFVSGGIVVPVWVDLTGFLATARIRFQLTPNPPFLSLMTTTLLGLPKVTLKCTPLAKNFLNVMDVPGLSSWLQKSINMAVEEYVSPRSLTMDLKTLLMGREKMDTEAVGVVIVTIKRAEEFKAGDGGKVFKTRDGQKGDAYVTIGWSKWGKPLWSTRIISGEGPVWEETTALLVGPSELNAQEALQLQLWDADRFTADDLLGNVELDLKDIMTNEQSHNRMSTRCDGLTSEKGDPWPGKIHWECGYFAKTSFDQHLAHKHRDAEKIRSKIEQEAEEKLREAKARDDHEEDGEVQQQKKEDMKEKSDEIIAGSKPTAEWPSGILSIRIEQISSLEIEKIQDSGVREDAEDGDQDDLPSPYCTIIINQQRVYKTRTKMKSNNPFYDAGTEKFIRDWTTTDVIISVRDSRIHEADPVIGIVVLPLRDVFKHNSLFTDSLPLVGGIGYGRMKLSLIFRSVQLILPKRLRGWDVGTLEISSNVKPSFNLPPDYQSCRLVFHTVYGKGKMVPSRDGGWVQKHGRPVRLAVKKRFASCLLIQLRKRLVGPDGTPAFCTLWLKDIPDDEEVDLELPVRKNEKGESIMEQSRANASTDIGDQIGTLKLKVRFWLGLSGYHKYTADHDKNMADVMEVLDYAEGEQDASKHLLEDEHEHESDTSSLTSSDGEDDVGESSTAAIPGGLAKKDGIVGQFNDFRKRKGELHRKHRGLMQWKAMRNVAWVGRGVENQAGKLTDKVKSTFTHHDRETGIEKEV